MAKAEDVTLGMLAQQIFAYMQAKDPTWAYMEALEIRNAIEQDIMLQHSVSIATGPDLIAGFKRQKGTAYDYVTAFLTKGDDDFPFMLEEKIQIFNTPISVIANHKIEATHGRLMANQIADVSFVADRPVTSVRSVTYVREVVVGIYETEFNTGKNLDKVIRCIKTDKPI